MNLLKSLGLSRESVQKLLNAPHQSPNNLAKGLPVPDPTTALIGIRLPRVAEAVVRKPTPVPALPKGLSTKVGPVLGPWIPKRLSRSDREVIRGLYLQGKTIEWISLKLGIPEGLVAGITVRDKQWQRRVKKSLTSEESFP